jgi:hypothetical protein
MTDEKTPATISTESQTDSQEDLIEKSFGMSECPYKNVCVVYSSKCNLIYFFIFVFVFLILKYFIGSFYQLQRILLSIHSLISEISFNVQNLVHLNKINLSNNTQNKVVKENEKCCNKTPETKIKTENKTENKTEETSEKKSECKDELNLKNMVQIIENLEMLFRNS